MPFLTFGMRRGRYALLPETVAEVRPAGPIRPIPMAPPAIAGVAHWRGEVVGVVDLVPLLDDVPAEPDRFLVRLAPPLEHTAILVRAAVALEEGDETEARILDPARLLAMV